MEAEKRSADRVTETFLRAAREDAQPARFSTPAEAKSLCVECDTEPRVEGTLFCARCYVARKI